MSAIATWLAPLITVILAIIGWVAADARSKAQGESHQEGISHLTAQHTLLLERLSNVEGSVRRAEQDRNEILRVIERAESRLEATKASREVVDSIKADITSLKQELSSRFDRMETLLQQANTR